MPGATAEGFPYPVSSDDNDNLADLNALANRADAILDPKTNAQITALATTDLFVGARRRQSDAGSGKRSQAGPYVYDGTLWQPEVGDDLGGSYTPALTGSGSNPNLGTSPTQVGDFWFTGDWVHANVIIAWGTGSPTPGTGDLIVSLPFSAVPWVAPSAARRIVVGQGRIRDASTGASTRVIAMVDGTTFTQCRLQYDNVSTFASGAAPLTLGATSDSIKLELCYLVA